MIVLNNAIGKVTKQLKSVGNRWRARHIDLRPNKLSDRGNILPSLDSLVGDMSAFAGLNEIFTGGLRVDTVGNTNEEFVPDITRLDATRSNLAITDFAGAGVGIQCKDLNGS
jgi:hypothetical protein